MKEERNIFWYKNSCRKRGGGACRHVSLMKEKLRLPDEWGQEDCRHLGMESGCKKHSGYSSGMGKVWPNKNVCLRAPLRDPCLQRPVWGGFRLPLHDLEHQDHTPQYQIDPRRVFSIV